MPVVTDNRMSYGSLCVVAMTALALMAFVWSPGASEYPLAALGILAFLFVQAFLPACRIRMSIPVCPVNIAQGYFWIQLVLVTVLVGYFDFSQGTLPYLPSKGAIDLAIIVQVIAYLSFCGAYQYFARESVRRALPYASPPGAAYLIVPFLVLGLLGFLLAYGGVAGFVEYLSSPMEQRRRAEEVATVYGVAGTFLKHFLGFAAVLAWSWWLGRAARTKSSMIAMSAGVLVVLLVSNFSYNRGSMLGPIIGLAAAFSVHVWRLPFKALILASVLALSVAYTFGWYRSTDLGIAEVSVSGAAGTWNVEEVVEFVQIYASAPQMSAYLIESLEGKFYYGETLLASLVYPIPVLGKPYRDRSGTVIFNELIYGDPDTALDQIIPQNGELYMNFYLIGVVLGNVLLGGFLALLQSKFAAARTAVESYAWVMLALWSVFPGSLSVASQIYVYTFWPIYSYFAVTHLWSWHFTSRSYRHPTAVKYS